MQVEVPQSRSRCAPRERTWRGLGMQPHGSGKQRNRRWLGCSALLLGSASRGASRPGEADAGGEAGTARHRICSRKASECDVTVSGMPVMAWPQKLRLQAQIPKAMRHKHPKLTPPDSKKSKVKASQGPQPILCSVSKGTPVTPFTCREAGGHARASSQVTRLSRRRCLFCFAWEETTSS